VTQQYILGEFSALLADLQPVPEEDRQPHLSRVDSAARPDTALDPYRDEHGNLPARLMLHKSSAFSADEAVAFADVVKRRDLGQLELVWIPSHEGTMLFRSTGANPPVRGMRVSMDGPIARSARGSVPFYRAYPGMHVPHRPSVEYVMASCLEGGVEGSIEDDAPDVVDDVADTGLGH
jgi:hypothetical protein